MTNSVFFQGIGPSGHSILADTLLSHTLSSYHIHPPCHHFSMDLLLYPWLTTPLGKSASCLFTCNRWSNGFQCISHHALLFLLPFLHSLAWNTEVWGIGCPRCGTTIMNVQALVLQPRRTCSTTHWELHRSHSPCMHCWFHDLRNHTDKPCSTDTSFSLNQLQVSVHLTVCPRHRGPPFCLNCIVSPSLRLPSSPQLL